MKTSDNAPPLEGDSARAQPTPGSAAYRRRILNVCATENTRDFLHALDPLFQQRGWRAPIDVVIEHVSALGHLASPEFVDAYGSVRLGSLIHVPDEEEILQKALDFAQTTYAELPAHRGFTEACKDGEDFAQLITELAPLWDQAATAFRRDGPAARDQACALFIRWLSRDHPNERNMFAARASSVTHAMFRIPAFPPGQDWVGEYLSNAPDVRGSIAWERDSSRLRYLGAPREVMVMADDPPPPPPRAQRRKRGKRYCAGCGAFHPE